MIIIVPHIKTKVNGKKFIKDDHCGKYYLQTRIRAVAGWNFPKRVKAKSGI